MILKKINSDIILAMKNKDSQKVTSLRYVKSLLLENTKSVIPKQDLDILLMYRKSLEKSTETFANHPDELLKINFDLTILGEYLPKQLTGDEIREIVLSIKNMKKTSNFGELMKESMAVLKGKADGKVVSAFIKEIEKGK